MLVKMVAKVIKTVEITYALLFLHPIAGRAAARVGLFLLARG